MFEHMMHWKICILVLFSCVFATDAYYLGRHTTPQTRAAKYEYYRNHHSYRHHSYTSSTPSPIIGKSNRFAHLDRLLSRLDAADAPATKLVLTTTTVSPMLSRLLHVEPKEEKEQTDYQYEDETEEEEVAEDDSEDGDDEDEAEEDSQNRSRHQGDEARYSSHTSWKWAHLGTHKGVEEVRNARLGITSSHRPPTRPSETEVREALQHSARVNREGSCKVPRAKVVNVRDVYPHPSKTYFPHCTILHQCGDDTGCCNSESRTCSPLKSHKVSLTFYTTTFTMDSAYVTTTERLIFYNHTECRCEDKHKNLMPQDMDPSTIVNSYPGSRSERNSVKCQCPSLYTARHHSDEKCTCDCFDKQKDCLRAKKGKDYFSFKDRVCIREEECITPSCEFGSYLRSAGRCPRKREKFAAWSRYFNRDYYGSHKK